MKEPDFPKMTTKQAFETDTRFFTATRKCNDCGSFRKYWTSKSQSFVCCYECVPYVEEYSKRDINKRIK